MTEQRKYSLDEIDQMRRDIRLVMEPIGGMWDPEKLDRWAEDRLRTYLQAGVFPAELASKAADYRLAFDEYWENWHKEKDAEREQRKERTDNSWVLQSDTSFPPPTDDQGSRQRGRGDVRRERIARFFRSLFG